MFSTDEKARAACEAMAQHEGVAWVGMVICDGRAESPGEVAGYAAVRRIGKIPRRGPGWWCAYIGLLPEYEASLRELDAHGDIHGGITFSTLSGMEEAAQSPRPAWVPLELESLCWIGWDYAHAGDFTGIVEDDDGKVWSLEEVVETELAGAVSQIRLGGRCLARKLVGRVVSLGEWVYGR